MIELRPYQSAAVQSARLALAGGKKRIVINSPTGSGKTVIAEAVIRGAVAKGKRVVFLCNRIGLVKQASQHLARNGIAHGILQGENTIHVHLPVIVASIQTVARRGMPDCDLIIIDEAHGVAGSREYRQVIFQRNLVPVVGLSATPFAKGMAKPYAELGGNPLFESLVVAATIRELIDIGFLVDCDIYAPSAPDLSSLKTQRNAFGEIDFSDKEAARASDTLRWLEISCRTGCAWLPIRRPCVLHRTSPTASTLPSASWPLVCLPSISTATRQRTTAPRSWAGWRLVRRW